MLLLRRKSAALSFFIACWSCYFTSYNSQGAVHVLKLQRLTKVCEGLKQPCSHRTGGSGLICGGRSPPCTRCNHAKCDVQGWGSSTTTDTAFGQGL